MPEKSSFFNHIEGDRVYNADDFAEYFNSVLTDGIFNGGENLSVHYSGTDRKARIKSGKAWIKGYFYHNTDDTLILEHDEADGTYDRIDRIVLRLDKNPESRYIKAFIKKGVPSSNPVPQELTRDDIIHEISLAQVLVVHNTTTIAPSNVKDERYDANLCGLVNSLIQVDTAAMEQQFEDFISNLDEQAYETKDGAQNKADIAENNAKEYTDSEISGISTQMDELQEKKLDKTAYTANDVRNKLKIVGGSGSGIDADTVDGWHRDSIRSWSNLLDKPNSFKPSSHTHNKSDVGLGSLYNYSIATKAEAQAGISNTKYMTPLRVKEAIVNGFGNGNQYLYNAGQIVKWVKGYNIQNHEDKPKPIAEDEGSYIYLQITGNGVTTFVIDLPVNVSDYKYLGVESSRSDFFCVILSSSKNGGPEEFDAKQVLSEKSETETTYLNISSLEGNKFIRLHLDLGTTWSSGYKYARVKKVFLTNILT